MKFFFGLMYIIVGIFDIVSDMSGALFSAVLFSHGFFYLVYRHYKSERDDRVYGRHWVLGSSEQSRAIISESIASERQNRDALHGMEKREGDRILEGANNLYATGAYLRAADGYRVAANKYRHIDEYELAANAERDEEYARAMHGSIATLMLEDLKYTEINKRR